MQDFTLHNNGPMLNNQNTDFLAALTDVLNHSGFDMNIKKKLFKKVNKILISSNSKDVHESEKEKFFQIACTVFDAYDFFVSNHFYNFADDLRECLNKFIPQVFDQNAPCTPYQKYAVIRMKIRLEMLNRVMKNHEDYQSHKSLNACLKNDQLTIFGKWGKLKRTVQSLPEKEKQDQYIIELCDVIDNDRMLIPKFKLGFQSLNKKLQNTFDETHAVIAHKIEMLKGILDGQECADLSSMVVPMLFQTSMPPDIEEYLKSKTYVHNNRMVINFKCVNTDGQSESQIALSLIDIYMANIKCFKRYGIESKATSMIMCMSDKLKRINDHNHDEAELYVASLKKIAESFSGCIFVGDHGNCNELNKITVIYSEAIVKCYRKFNKLYEHDGSENERQNFAEIYANIYAEHPKISKRIFDVLPQYLQNAINVKSQKDQRRNGLHSSRFFISEPNKENKKPETNISPDNNGSAAEISNKRRTTSR